MYLLISIEDFTLRVNIALNSGTSDNWSTQDLTSLLAVFISFVALVATFAQLYLQKRHNEQSLRPYGQIDLKDRRNTVYVYIKNYGLGPMIVQSVLYNKNGHEYDNIESCIDGLDPHSYMHIVPGDRSTKALMPGQHLAIFETILTDAKTVDKVFRDDLRLKLSQIQIKILYKDIYGNSYECARDLSWFYNVIGKIDKPNKGLQPDR